MSDYEWVPIGVAPGERGDLFAVLVEKRVASKLRHHNGEYVEHVSCEATVIARGSLSRRCFFGGTVVNGFEHHIVVVDADGGPPVVVIAHSRDQAPLQALDMATGDVIWSSPDLRGAWALTAGKRSRLVGASYVRSSSKLVSADTGKYRWKWEGDVAPLIADGSHAIGSRRKSGSYTMELRDVSDGNLLFARDGILAWDAVVSGALVVVAGNGLQAFELDGTLRWSFEPESKFNGIVALPNGFRGYSAQRGIVDVREGLLIREFDHPRLADSTFLGSDHLLSKEGIRTIDGQEVWNFVDDLRECAKTAADANDAIRRDASPSGTHSTSAKRVFHRRFGWGTVLEEMAAKTRVKFDDDTERTIASEFLSTSE